MFELGWKASLFAACLALAACGGDVDVDLAGYGADAVIVTRRAASPPGEERWTFDVDLHQAGFDGVSDCDLLAPNVRSDVNGRPLALVHRGGAVDSQVPGVQSCSDASFELEMPRPDAAEFSDGVVTISDASRTIVAEFPGLFGGVVPRSPLDEVAPGDPLVFDFFPPADELGITFVQVGASRQPVDGVQAEANTISFEMPAGAETGKVPLRIATAVASTARRCEGVASCIVGSPITADPDKDVEDAALFEVSVAP